MASSTDDTTDSHVPWTGVNCSGDYEREEIKLDQKFKFSNLFSFMSYMLSMDEERRQRIQFSSDPMTSKHRTRSQHRTNATDESVLVCSWWSVMRRKCRVFRLQRYSCQLDFEQSSHPVDYKKENGKMSDEKIEKLVEHHVTYGIMDVKMAF